METELKNIIGKTVQKIFVNQEYLKFVTDEGTLLYRVTGDCCSRSFFYDFYGVKNLLGHKVLEVKNVELIPGDVIVKNAGYDLTQVYGYQITTESTTYGDVTSVFSFRNESNGFYGGSIEEVSSDVGIGEMKELTEDVVEIK